MRNLDIIQNSIDYIEENLKTEIAAQELADKANFSLFYYYRLFQTDRKSTRLNSSHPSSSRMPSSA